MKKIVFGMIAFILACSEAFAVGFVEGNVRTSVRLEGQIMLVCDDPFQGGVQFSHFNCQKEILSPSEYDYFRGPEEFKADEAILTALREDNTSYSKTVKYDAEKMQSRKPINLWILTLFQKPLLHMGRNKISYILKLKGKTVGSGNFDAIVNDGGVKTCGRRGHYQSNIGSECFGSGANYCNQYFFDYRNCFQ